jgi:hypothetical protein
MKKTYQQPTANFLGMMTSEMMVSSLTMKDGAPYQDLGDAPTTTETSGNLSRRRSVWDDGDSGFEEEF